MGVPTPQFSASSDGRVMLWHGHEPPVFVDAATARDAIGAAAEESLRRKDYIINGSMMVSQQNGTTAGTTSGYYPVDQFRLEFSNSGTQTIQQVASVTPAGSPNRIRLTATVADASVAATDYCMIAQKIEGLRVADLRLGSASAKTITVQFGVKAPAGTYCVSLRNSVGTRGFAAEYTISGPEANTDVVKSITVALDQVGTWLSDTSSGLEVIWILMCGTTFQTPAGAWAAGNFLASSNQSNFMGTGSNVFELFDVSMVPGTTAPEHQVRDYAETLLACQRYWEYGSFIMSGSNGSSAEVSLPFNFRSIKRAAPSMTLTNKAAAGSASTANFSTTSVATYKFVGSLGTVGAGAFIGAFDWIADSRL